MNVIKKQTVPSLLSIWPVAGFIYQHVSSITIEFRLAHLHNDAGKVNRTETSLSSNRLSSHAPEKSENSRKQADFIHRRTIKMPIPNVLLPAKSNIADVKQLEDAIAYKLKSKETQNPWKTKLFICRIIPLAEVFISLQRRRGLRSIPGSILTR